MSPGCTPTPVDGLPLMTDGFDTMLRLALLEVGHPSPYAVTAHSMHRGGAPACAVLGASLEDIKTLGNWKSTAVNVYLNNNPTSGKMSLVKHFG